MLLRFTLKGDCEKECVNIKPSHSFQVKPFYSKGIKLIECTGMSLTIGETIARTDDGKLAALFHYIDGINPVSGGALKQDSFGSAVGQLTRALGRIKPAKKPAYMPYYELEHTHSSCPLDKVLKLCENPAEDFAEHRQALNVVGMELAGIRKEISFIKQLPQQLIHGDLNSSNILTNEKGEVTAILDFEFVTEDLRVMELAVCLSDLIHSAGDETAVWDKIDKFLYGYGSVIKLTPDEVKFIPLLVQVRRMDVFIHFLGRYLDRITKKDIVEDQICNVVWQVGWLNANKEKLMEMCRSHLL